MKQGYIPVIVVLVILLGIAFISINLTGLSINPVTMDYSHCDLNCSSSACVDNNNTPGITICLNGSLTSGVTIGASNQTLDCMGYDIFLKLLVYHLTNLYIIGLSCWKKINTYRYSKPRNFFYRHTVYQFWKEK